MHSRWWWPLGGCWGSLGLPHHRQHHAHRGWQPACSNSNSSTSSTSREGWAGTPHFGRERVVLSCCPFPGKEDCWVACLHMQAAHQVCRRPECSGYCNLPCVCPPGIPTCCCCLPFPTAANTLLLNSSTTTAVSQGTGVSGTAGGGVPYTVCARLTCKACPVARASCLDHSNRQGHHI